jgi:hypothetical protein
MANPASTNEKHDIAFADGQRITDEAANWEDTPYALLGPTSVKGTGGDCSGSTYLIYDAAGFHYEYQVAAAFQDYAITSGLFRLLGVGEKKQDGDILSWSNHMAIFATFQNDSAHATTPRVTKTGQKWTQNNDMWTASHLGGQGYAPAEMRWWRADPPKAFRYRS